MLKQKTKKQKKNIIFYEVKIEGVRSRDMKIQ